MQSILRSERRRNTKKRRLGKVEILRREAYTALALEVKVEMIRSLVPLGLMHVQELLDEEIDALASGWYHRKSEAIRGRRHGSNPGSVPIAGQRVAYPNPAHSECARRRSPLADLCGLEAGRSRGRAAAHAGPVWDLVSEL